MYCERSCDGAGCASILGMLCRSLWTGQAEPGWPATRFSRDGLAVGAPASTGGRLVVGEWVVCEVRVTRTQHVSVELLLFGSRGSAECPGWTILQRELKQVPDRNGRERW